MQLKRNMHNAIRWCDSNTSAVELETWFRNQVCWGLFFSLLKFKCSTQKPHTSIFLHIHEYKHRKLYPPFWQQHTYSGEGVVVGGGGNMSHTNLDSSKHGRQFTKFHIMEVLGVDKVDKPGLLLLSLQPLQQALWATRQGHQPCCTSCI